MCRHIQRYQGLRALPTAMLALRQRKGELAHGIVVPSPLIISAATTRPVRLRVWIWLGGSPQR